MGDNYAQGWDLVAASRQKEINEAIALAYAKGLLPTDFSVDFTIEIFGVTIKVNASGVFGPMSLAGGTGADVDVQIPIDKGTIKGPNSYEIDISGVVVVMTINLTYVESEVQPETGHNYDFKIDFTNEKAFVGIDLKNLPDPLKSQATAIEIAMINAIRNAAAGKEYTVATVNLKGVDEDYPELVPTLCEYAFVNDGSGNGDDNTMALMALTINTTPGAQQVLDGTIPDGDRAALILSNPVFMSYFMKPSCASGFETDVSNFSTTPIKGQQAVTINATKEFNAKSVTVKGKTYHPKVTSFSAQIDKDKVELDIDIEIVPTPGINLKYSVTAPYTFTIKVVSDGQELDLSLYKDGYKESKSVNASWWVWLLVGAASLIWPIIGSIIALIVVLIIEAVVKSKAPSLEDSAFGKPIKAFTWNHRGIFDIKHVYTPLPIQVGGDLPFLDS